MPEKIENVCDLPINILRIFLGILQKFSAVAILLFYLPKHIGARSINAPMLRDFTCQLYVVSCKSNARAERI